jgi:hypothetical protein
MKKHELKLTYHTGSIVVGRHACNRKVNVALNAQEYKSYRWGGFIDYDMALCEPKTEYVFVGCFQGNNAYRKKHEFEWNHISSASAWFLAGLVDVDSVYGILRDDEPWVVHMTKYSSEELPIKHPNGPRPPPRNNVYNLFA